MFCVVCHFSVNSNGKKSSSIMNLDCVKILLSLSQMAEIMLSQLVCENVIICVYVTVCVTVSV